MELIVGTVIFLVSVGVQARLQTVAHELMLLRSCVSDSETFGVSFIGSYWILGPAETLTYSWGALLVECHPRAGLLGTSLFNAVSSLLSSAAGTASRAQCCALREFQPTPVLALVLVPLSSPPRLEQRLVI